MPIRKVKMSTLNARCCTVVGCSCNLNEVDNEPIQTTPGNNVPAPERTKNRESTFKSVLTTIAILIAAPIAALLITSFIFQSYEVFGPSMMSTLQNGDRLIVVKAPRTWAKITGRDYQPTRGEIIVFVKRDLLIAGESGNKQLIKRVMALPGEKVVVKDGVVTVYSASRPEGFQPDKEGAYGSVIQKTGIDGEWTVGNDEVFVCGDNRDNSLDSRTFGPIREADIVGTAKFRFMPTSQSRSF